MLLCHRGTTTEERIQQASADACLLSRLLCHRGTTTEERIQEASGGAGLLYGLLRLGSAKERTQQAPVLSRGGIAAQERTEQAA